MGLRQNNVALVMGSRRASVVEHDSCGLICPPATLASSALLPKA